MKPCKLPALAALILALAGAPAPALAADAAPAVAFEKYTLPNGLEVILVEDHKLPLTAVNLWYHVGPANEAPGRTGFAHLFEHMMFAATRHVPRGLADRLLEGAGATDSNGSTDFDRTNYFDTVPSNQLELALWTHADRMGYLLDSLDQTALSNQQDVVRNERRQSSENRPYGIVDEAMFHALFPVGHPYRPMIIGSHVDIQAARIADVRDFFKRYYRPNNATLVIAGDFDTANAKRLVQKEFGTFRRGVDIASPSVVTPALTSEQRLTVTDQIELERLDIGWLTPPKFAPDDAELTIASSILAGGKASRLYQKLVHDLEVAQDVSADQDSYALTSIFQLQAVARAGHTAAELQPLVDAELKRLADEGPTDREVERARNQIERTLYADLQKVGGRADQLNMYNQYLGDPGYLPKDIERYARVSAADVKRAVRERLRGNARVVIYAVRGEKKLDSDPPPPAPIVASGTESINADEPWRNTTPKPGPVRVPVLPKPQSFKLANGLTVLHLQRPQMPLVSIELVVNGGLASTDPALPGVPDFAASLLDEGTTTRDSLAIAEQLEQLGSAYNALTLRDTTTLVVESLSRNAGDSMRVLADIAQHPVFPPDEIERERKSRESEIASAREEGATLAGAAFARAVFGPANPLGVPGIGTEQSVAQTTRDDLNRWWQARFRPQNAALIVVGAIDAASARELAEREWGAWQGVGTAPAPAAVPVPTMIKARAIIVDKPNAPQTELRVGRLGTVRTTPDYPALQVLNFIVGGGYTSRINQNLREDKGYTYGAQSRFDYGRTQGAFYVATAVRTDVSGPAVAEILAELARAHSSPISPSEMAQGRGALMQSLPARFETNGAVAASFSDLFVYAFPLDYFQRLPAEYASVRAPAADKLAHRYLDPSTMVIIAVGDRKQVEPALAKLGIESIQVWPIAGTLF